MRTLNPGDIVDIVATSFNKDPKLAALAADFLKSWGFCPRVPEDILGDHPLYANTDEMRLDHLKNALLAPDSAAVWCLRGGSGATKLLPGLGALPIPPKSQEKCVIGFSDVTAFHIFLPQAWGWQTVHGPNLRQMAEKEYDTQTVQTLKALLFGETDHVEIPGLVPLNRPAKDAGLRSGPLTGGNFSLVQHSVGTPWQLDTRDKIIFLEDVDELPYRTAQRLEHLLQAGLWDHAKAIVFFDFSHNNPVEEMHTGLQEFVFQDFARRVSVPVFRGQGVGHANPNIPLVAGAPATLEGGTLRSYAA